MPDSFRTDTTSALQTGNGRVPLFTVVRPPEWATKLEPSPTSRFDTGPCHRYFGSVLVERQEHALQGVLTLEVTLVQVSAVLQAARRQSRLFSLPLGVRRHVHLLVVEAVSTGTGLSRELAALLAVKDTVKWASVLNHPPYRRPRAGASAHTRHSLRKLRTAAGEESSHGWASTGAVVDRGIPIVAPDPFQEQVA